MYETGNLHHQACSLAMLPIILIFLHPSCKVQELTVVSCFKPMLDVMDLFSTANHFYQSMELYSLTNLNSPTNCPHSAELLNKNSNFLEREQRIYNCFLAIFFILTTILVKRRRVQGYPSYLTFFCPPSLDVKIQLMHIFAIQYY